jgi:hypothetical protein
MNKLKLIQTLGATNGLSKRETKEIISIFSNRWPVPVVMESLKWFLAGIKPGHPA